MFPPINGFVGLVIAWRLVPFVVGDGEIYDELVKVVFGEFVPISILFSQSSMSLVKLVS